ncbi:MAG: hypothetical protein GXP10_02825 [Gammaproteobacteria bacterium]|nr:hypothetical protein [Gammaproteobacteria bacterium]
MSENKTESVAPVRVRCSACGYEGDQPRKGNERLKFLVLVGILIGALFFLPLVIVGLVYMLWMVGLPPRDRCPECKERALVVIANETRPDDKNVPDNDDSGTEQE